MMFSSLSPSALSVFLIIAPSAYSTSACRGTSIPARTETMPANHSNRPCPRRGSGSRRSCAASRTKRTMTMMTTSRSRRSVVLGRAFSNTSTTARASSPSACRLPSSSTSSSSVAGGMVARGAGGGRLDGLCWTLYSSSHELRLTTTFENLHSEMKGYACFMTRLLLSVREIRTSDSVSGSDETLPLICCLKFSTKVRGRVNNINAFDYKIAVVYKILSLEVVLRGPCQALVPFPSMPI